jgi:uncharacterized protein YqgC (DUF456 family)
MDNVEGPLLALTIVLMFVGLLGSVVPGLPGVTLIFLSGLLYAVLTDFRIVGPTIVVILCVFAILAFLADFFATSYGARRFGASNWGTVGGAIGGIVGALAGLLFAGIGALFGLIAGTIAGVFVGEYLRRERHGDPEKTGSRRRRLAPCLTGCRRRHRRLPGFGGGAGTARAGERDSVRADAGVLALQPISISACFLLTG